jgi:hypothetical protein
MNNLITRTLWSKFCPVLPSRSFKWSTVPDFSGVSASQGSPEELTKLIAAYNDPVDLRASGLWMNGEKYVVVRSDERSIYGKLVGSLPLSP